MNQVQGIGYGIQDHSGTAEYTGSLTYSAGKTVLVTGYLKRFPALTDYLIFSFGKNGRSHFSLHYLPVLDTRYSCSGQENPAGVKSLPQEMGIQPSSPLESIRTRAGLLQIDWER
jgi:hypothetical protein